MKFCNCSRLAAGIGLQPYRGLNRGSRVLCLAVLSLVLGISTTNMAAAQDTVVAVKASQIYVGSGQVIHNGVILIKAGRIVDVGSDLEVPADAKVVHIEQGCVTPGLVDANARIESTNLLPDGRVATTLIPNPHDPADHDELDSHEEVEYGSAEPVLGFSRNGPLPLHIPEEGEEHEGHQDDSFAIGVRSSELVNEQSSEVVPHTIVLDALNLDSGDFDRLVHGGVTTVYVSPDPSAVIGARGSVVHTSGAIDGRVLQPTSAVKATIGSEPSRLGTSNRTPSRYSMTMYARRPNSRMGLVWVFRKAFYDAQRRAKGVEAYGADTADPEATAVLAEVLDKKVPFRIQARLQRDILTALRLAEEFDLTFTLEEATEAYRCIDELKSRQVPVVFGPIYETASGIRSRSGEGQRSRFFTFRALLDAGITTALSAQEYREEDGLARQAMYAMRFGVSFDDALRAVTLTPAEMIGLDDQIGSIEVGKRADLVIWSGQPFAATSRILLVLVDGEAVVDRR